MEEQGLKDKITEIEHLHQHYYDLRENTPFMKRYGEECKAYHKWYDAAYVFFNSIEGLKGTDDFKLFANAQKDGNCFVLEHIYDSISASYKVLMNQAKEMNIRERNSEGHSQANTWPFETNYTPAGCLSAIRGITIRIRTGFSNRVRTCVTKAWVLSSTRPCVRVRTCWTSRRKELPMRTECWLSVHPTTSANRKRRRVV